MASKILYRAKVWGSEEKTCDDMLLAKERESFPRKTMLCVKHMGQNWFINKSLLRRSLLRRMFFWHVPWMLKKQEGMCCVLKMVSRLSRRITTRDMEAKGRWSTLHVYISSNQQHAWGTRDRRMAKQWVAGAMQGVRNKDLKELHVGSGNEEGIERQACMKENLFTGGGRITM
jgi:hypothetical protein